MEKNEIIELTKIKKNLLNPILSFNKYEVVSSTFISMVFSFLFDGGIGAPPPKPIPTDARTIKRISPDILNVFLKLFIIT